MGRMGQQLIKTSNADDKVKIISLTENKEVKKKIKPLTLKQIEEGACGGLDALIPLNSKTIPDGKSIYEFTDEKYHNGKPRSSDEWKESYREHY